MTGKETEAFEYNDLGVGRTWETLGKVFRALPRQNRYHRNKNPSLVLDS